MSLLSPSTLIQQLNWRHATKKFDPARKISPEDWAVLEQALHMAPSSYGLQPWRFIVITSPEVRQKLRAVAHDQPQVTDSSHFVVLAAKKGLDAAYVDHYFQRISEVRQVPLEKLEEYRQRILGSIKSQTPEQVDVWSSRQVYIALGFLLSSAAMMGIDACPMEGIDKEKFDEILGLRADGFTAMCAAAVGYRAADDHYGKLPKVRFPLEETVKRIA